VLIPLQNFGRAVVQLDGTVIYPGSSTYEGAFTSFTYFKFNQTDYFIFGSSVGFSKNTQYISVMTMNGNSALWNSFQTYVYASMPTITVTQDGVGLYSSYGNVSAITLSTGKELWKIRDSSSSPILVDNSGLLHYMSSGDFVTIKISSTGSPTSSPTPNPTRAPTRTPTERPSRAPTGAPTRPTTPIPTKEPTTRAPTEPPTNSTTAPTSIGPGGLIWYWWVVIGVGGFIVLLVGIILIYFLCFRKTPETSYSMIN